MYSQMGYIGTGLALCIASFFSFFLLHFTFKLIIVFFVGRLGLVELRFSFRVNVMVLG